MSKYDPLRDHLWQLSQRNMDTWRASFAQIDAIVPLPASAYKFEQWWENERHGSHVQAWSWLDAGWRTREIDLVRKKVTFFRY